MIAIEDRMMARHIRRRGEEAGDKRPGRHEEGEHRPPHGDLVARSWKVKGRLGSDVARLDSARLGWTRLEV